MALCRGPKSNQSFLAIDEGQVHAVVWGLCEEGQKEALVEALPGKRRSFTCTSTCPTSTHPTSTLTTSTCTTYTRPTSTHSSTLTVPRRVTVTDMTTQTDGTGMVSVGVGIHLFCPVMQYRPVDVSTQTGHLQSRYRRSHSF